MNTKKLSIIIPAYNAGEHIEKCVTSITDQPVDQSKYEIVIINDGSTDDTAHVIAGLRELYSNIVVVDQQNKGVSMARNAGIDKAEGEYVVFVDADDFIAPGSLKIVLNRATKGNSQLTFLGFQSLEESFSPSPSFQFLDDPMTILTGIEAYTVLMKNLARDPDSSVAVLFWKKFLLEHNLKFTGSIPYLEDCEFMARVFCLATTCSFEGTPFYIRVTREGSATNSGLFHSEAAVNGFFFAAMHLKEFKASPLLTEKQAFHVNQPITKFTLLIVQSSIGQGLNRYRRVKRRLKAQQLDRTDIRGCSSFYARYGRIYNISTDLFVFVWSTRLLNISIKKRARRLFSNTITL